ncbi:MAG: alpha/beta fold hydrolase [Salinisphaeraceae bacterium]
MRKLSVRPLITALAALFLLAACGGGSGGDGLSLGPGDNGDDPGDPGNPDPASRAGESYRQAIQVPSTGDTLIAQVFEPTTVTEGETYPLVLHSHGYGGSRNVTPSDFQQRLRDAGYYVVSFDQRGFGESSGTVRIQSPDFEGRDLIALLDWTEANLDQLAYRDGRMVVGSYGGSYGGMYQVLLAAVDPEQRLRVIAPDITPHALTYSLSPGGAIKSGWALALVAGGELPLLGLATGGAGPEALVDEIVTLALERQNLRQDPMIAEILADGALTNRLSDSGRNLLAYHSFRHFCDAQVAGPQDGFVVGTPDPRAFSPGTPPPAVDALITQGFKDTLFNVNEALENYSCLRQAGGDVRLLTHQTGHVLPASLETLGLEAPLDPFYAAINPPAFQDSGGSFSCGSLDLDDVRFGWFEAKLKRDSAALDSALPIGDEICLSLAEGDAITVDEVATGGTSVELAMTTETNGVTGVLASLAGGEVLEPLELGTTPLTTVDQPRILAGVPRLSVTVETVVSLLSDLGLDCALEVLPGLLPPGCDPILFFAVVQRPPGQERWDMVDDQLTPVRGFDTHELDMVAIAERLPAGTELGLRVFGFHPQYPVTLSRDLLVPAVTIEGRVELPLLGATDIVRDGV